MKGTAFAFFALALMLAGCTVSHTGQQAPPADTAVQPALQTFFISSTAQNGLAPNRLIVKTGAILSVTSIDTDTRITSAELGIDKTIASGSSETVTILPKAPGNYTLQCASGCPKGSAISIEVR